MKKMKKMKVIKMKNMSTNLKTKENYSQIYQIKMKNKNKVNKFYLKIISKKII